MYARILKTSQICPTLPPGATLPNFPRREPCFGVLIVYIRPPCVIGSEIMDEVVGPGLRVNHAVTRDLVSYISEFLVFHDFPRAAACLNEERNYKRAALASSIGHRPSGNQREKLRLDMVSYFDSVVGFNRTTLVTCIAVQLLTWRPGPCHRRPGLSPMHAISDEIF